MHRSRVVTASAMTLILLVITMLPKAAEGRGAEEEQKPIKLYATATAGPIGRVQPFASMSIDGRASRDEQLLWGGEVLEATAGNVQVRLDSVAVVTLMRGAVVRLATARSSQQEHSQDVVVGRLIRGELRMSLSESAGAYLEAQATVVNASTGASFRVAIAEREVEVTATRGEVSQVQANQPRYLIKPVGLGATASVRARQTRQIQVQVTDEQDRPVPDVPVIFAVGGPGGGSLGAGAAVGTTVTVTTNAQGIAVASFTAGQAAGTSSVTATIAGTNISTTIGVTTVAAAGILTGTTLAIVVAAAAAGTAATVVAVTQQNEEQPSEPIVALPPTIRPRP